MIISGLKFPVDLIMFVELEKQIILFTAGDRMVLDVWE